MSDYLLYYGTWAFFISMALYWTVRAKRLMKLYEKNPNDPQIRYFIGSNIDYYGGIIAIAIFVVIVLISLYNQFGVKR